MKSFEKKPDQDWNAYANFTPEKVMEKFEASGAWNLPVLEDEKYVGYVSKSKLFSAYRKLLRDFYEED